jgi:hypothetical protein
MTSLTFRRTALVAVGVLALASCSKSGDSGIAHLGSGATPSASASVNSADAEQQALAFAQCMRDNGVDFPDPTVDAQGNLTFEGAFQQSQGGGFDPGDTSFRDAMTACQDLMQGLVLGGGQAGGGFDSTAMQDAMLAYTQCLRDQGLDVGDITFDGPGLRGNGANGPGSGAQPTVQPSGGPPAGVRQDGGDRTDMFAQILGQDPTDPAWIAANTACASTLEAVTSNFQPGGATANGQG